MGALTRRAMLQAGAASAVLAGATGRALAADQVSITFGPVTPIYATSLIAQEKGFLRDEGIDLKLVTTDAGARARQNLAAGEAMFAHGDASHPLQLTHRGKASKIILVTSTVPSYASICVRQDLYEAGITSIEAFAAWKRPGGGKPILGVTAIGSGTWMFSTYLFEQRKLDRNVTWVASGGASTALAGLKSRQFDAIAAPPSWQIEAERNGYGRLIYDVRVPGVFAKDFGGPIPVSAIYALEETIQQKPELTQRFVNALVRAMAYVKATPVAEVLALLDKRYFAGFDPEATKAELSFDPAAWPAYSGVITREDFARGAPVWYRQGTDIPPTRFEDVVDMRFAEAAQKKAA
ncbi:MAG: ABC transporter substrate-binding protein [Rhizobiales bacterium]|nr:ABC transporter substrate-binding protein [Hyphomicrobiales bacterium]